MNWTDTLCESGRFSRRTALAGLGTIGLLGAGVRAAFGRPAESANHLVVIFLRGGADGLNLVAPYAEDDYYQARPSVAVPNPKSTVQDKLLDLDGFFGLHPRLANLYPLYREGQLGIVHAVGSGDQTRSHFEAMASMERGLFNANDYGASGWLGRFLNENPRGSGSPLRAVAMNSVMPDALRGATEAIAIPSLDDFKLDARTELGTYQDLFARLSSAYAEGDDPMAQAGRETLAVMKRLQEAEGATASKGTGAQYGSSDLAQGLRQVASLLRAGVGMQIAWLDMGGWDTHIAQGASTGLHANLAQDLGDSLSVFWNDLGSFQSSTTVVVMTEFGRRIEENSGLGTDHGRGSVMWVLGSNVRGGKVHVKWPGIGKEQREGPGDLPVTTDYRQILGEIVTRNLKGRALEKVFPNLNYRPIGIFT